MKKQRIDPWTTYTLLYRKPTANHWVNQSKHELKVHYISYWTPCHTVILYCKAIDSSTIIQQKWYKIQFISSVQVVYKLQWFSGKKNWQHYMLCWIVIVHNLYSLPYKRSTQHRKWNKIKMIYLLYIQKFLVDIFSPRAKKYLFFFINQIKLKSKFFITYITIT